MSATVNNEKYTTLSDYLNDETKVSKAEKAQIDSEVELIGKLIEAREAKSLSQRGFNEFLAEQLKDPIIKAEYDALEPEFTAIEATIKEVMENEKGTFLSAFFVLFILSLRIRQRHALPFDAHNHSYNTAYTAVTFRR